MNLRLAPPLLDSDTAAVECLRRMIRIADDDRMPAVQSIGDKAGTVEVHVRHYEDLANWRAMLDAHQALLTGVSGHGNRDVEWGFLTEWSGVRVWVGFTEPATKPCHRCGTATTAISCGDCLPVVVR